MASPADWWVGDSSSGPAVGNLDRSCDLYLRLGFRRIPNAVQPDLRYLTFGHT